MIKTKRILGSLTLATAGFCLALGGTAEAQGSNTSETSNTSEVTKVAQAELTPIKRVAKGLLEFEAAVRWKHVSPKWKKRRATWVRMVIKAKTAQGLAAMVGALEGHMGWPSVQPKWRGTRPGWVARLKAAKTAKQVAILLVVLESYTKWTTVYKWWGKKRKPWLRSMKSV